MNKIKKLVAGCLLMVPAMLAAEDYPWLTFTLADDSAISVPSELLTIDYQEGKLKLSSPSVSREIPLNEVKSMKFTPSESGILEVAGVSQEDAVELFTVGGISAGKFRSMEQARHTLPSGIYLVKSGNKSLKVIF